MMRMFGGGGGLPPGVAGDGQVPGGVNVAGGIVAGHVKIQKLNDDDLGLQIVLTPGSSGQEVSMSNPDLGVVWHVNADGAESLLGGIGEYGKGAPASAASVTGNVTTGTLTDLQGVVGALLTALDAKGTIAKNTT